MDTQSRGMNTRLTNARTSRYARLLPTVLGVIAGSADVTSFLGLGLFSAHVTGNLVILMAHFVARRVDNACLILSVPLFTLVLGLTRLLVAGLEAIDISLWRPLLVLQFLMLGGSFALGLASDPHQDLEAPGMILAGQLSVAAMAVQNALGELVLHRSPSTTVMTTNLTRFIMDAGEALLGHDATVMTEARHRARDTWPVIIGFIVGAGLGAACFAAAGLKSLGLPASLTLLALVMSLFLPGQVAESSDEDYRKRTLPGPTDSGPSSKPPHDRPR
jgi:uncharacterized membrane protein YoaK (UPF0700 family)